MTDAHVHAGHARPAVARGDRPFNLDREGDVPAVGLPASGGGENPGGALLQAAGNLASRLMGLEDPDPRELNVLAVGQHLDRAGGEPTRVSGAILLLEPREANRLSFAAAASRVAPVL